MSNDFFRVPEAAVGQRIHADPWDVVTYNSGTTAFSIGDIVTDSVTGRVGWIANVVGNTLEGTLVLKVTSVGTGRFAAGSSLEVATVGYATAAADSHELWVQGTVITSGDDPHHHQNVDGEGQAFVRFAEGAPHLDAFGKLQISQQSILSEYILSYDTMEDYHSDETVGTASITYIPEAKGGLIATGTGATDAFKRTTDRYHPYQAGFSQLLEFTAALGDTGKANVTRRMGYYDDADGVFFEMLDTTFNLVLRSTSTGSLVETRIPQSDWNGDKMDGTGLSGLVVDPSKVNIFWIDFQWLGAGTVRFGVNVNGKRITCHSLHNSNKNVLTYMGSGSLPVRYEQFNTGVPASSSEMKVFCTTVKIEGEFEPLRLPYGDDNTVSVTTTSATPVFGLRAGALYKTLPNRNVIYLQSGTLYNAAAEPMIVEAWSEDVQATAGVWSAKGGNSSAEVNKTATGFTNGQPAWSAVVAPGGSVELGINSLLHTRNGLNRKANHLDTPAQVLVTAKLAVAGTGGNCIAAFHWDEVIS